MKKSFIKTLQSTVLLLLMTIMFSCSKESNIDDDTNDNNNNVTYFFKGKIDGNFVETTNKANCVYTHLGTQLVIQGSIDNAIHQFNLKIFNYSTPKVYPINASNDVWGLYQNQSTYISYLTVGHPQTGSYVEVTYYDQASQTVKGNFKFIGKQSDETATKNITEGSFCCYGGI